MSGRHISSLVSVGLLSSATAAAAADRGPWILHATLSAACSLPPHRRHPPLYPTPTRLCLSSSPSRLPPPVSCPFKLSRDLKRKKREEKKAAASYSSLCFFPPPTLLFMLLVYFFLYPTLTSIQSIFISFYIPGTHGCKYKINSDSFVFSFVKFICLWHVKKKSHS